MRLVHIHLKCCFVCHVDGGDLREPDLEIAEADMAAICSEADSVAILAVNRIRVAERRYHNSVYADEAFSVDDACFNVIFAVGFCSEGLRPSEKLAFGIALDARSVYIPAVDAADIADIRIADIIIPPRCAEGEIEVVIAGGDNRSVKIEDDIALIFKMLSRVNEAARILAV